MVGRLSCPNIGAFSGSLGVAKSQQGRVRDNLVFYATSQELCRTPPKGIRCPSLPGEERALNTLSRLVLFGTSLSEPRGMYSCNSYHQSTKRARQRIVGMVRRLPVSVRATTWLTGSKRDFRSDVSNVLTDCDPFDQESWLRRIAWRRPPLLRIRGNFALNPTFFLDTLRELYERFFCSISFSPLTPAVSSVARPRTSLDCRR
jgi:hypothetical protein